MKVIYNKVIPFKGFKAVNLFGVLFVRKGKSMKRRDINHEAIHTEQWKELFYVGFLVWYVAEFLIRLAVVRNWHAAYRSISFEQEAYAYQDEPDYLAHRKQYTWFKFIINKKNES